MERDITYVGMDVHKETVAVTYVRGGSKPEVWELIPNSVAVVLKTLWATPGWCATRRPALAGSGGDR